MVTAFDRLLAGSTTSLDTGQEPERNEDSCSTPSGAAHPVPPAMTTAAMASSRGPGRQPCRWPPGSSSRRTAAAAVRCSATDEQFERMCRYC